MQENAKISRNAPCPCGSGKKYKLCCGAKAIAAERDAEARRSRFWTPDGVVSCPDDTPLPWPNGRPKWSMKLAIREENSPEDDAKAFIEKLIRPYFDRYCDMAADEEGEDCEIAVLEAFSGGMDPLNSAPDVLIGKHGQLWDMLRDKIAAIQGDCNASEVTCEVRWDFRHGGPIMTFTDNQSKAMFFVSKTSRFRK